MSSPGQEAGRQFSAPRPVAVASVGGEEKGRRRKASRWRLQTAAYGGSTWSASAAKSTNSKLLATVPSSSSHAASHAPPQHRHLLPTVPPILCSSRPSSLVPIVSGRGYREYRLGEYSTWMQHRVEDSDNWARIRGCLHDGSVFPMAECVQDSAGR
ncbi:hypothetical protein ZWY2020_049392 [Hordeum vulgare]|nr:hypothetical protein ZWY2020_049392 [Hordeum vulgare]